MKFKKSFIKPLFVSALAVTIFAPTHTFAETDTTYESYSKEEIQNAAEKENEKRLTELKANHSDAKTMEQNKDAELMGTFYTEWPVDYDPDYTEYDKDAYKIGQANFDTRGEVGDSTNITATYSEQTSVAWTISGTAEASAEFKVLSNGVEASVSVTVSRQTSTSENVGFSKDYSVATGEQGYIRVYAPAYNTGGAMKYNWEDREGNTGSNYKFVTSTVPTEVTSTDVTFGPVVYQ